MFFNVRPPRGQPGGAKNNNVGHRFLDLQIPGFQVAIPEEASTTKWEITRLVTFGLRVASAEETKIIKWKVQFSHF